MVIKDVFPKELQAQAKAEAQEMGERKLVQIREIEKEFRGLRHGPGFHFYHKVIGNTLVNAQHHVKRKAWDWVHNDLEIVERALANYKRELRMPTGGKV